ncbi:MAG: DUF2914 domain-containing protein [Bdellovibrionales bacterium]|nr:DUF2914 domain-containing protein [Bdellovibrionales bacterium]
MREKIVAALKSGEWLVQKYKPYKPALFFVLGFVFDMLTIGEADNLTSILQQFLYIFAIGTLLKYSLLKKEGLWAPHQKIERFWPYTNEALHFLLGGLLSVYTLFYFVSSSLATSLVFLTVMFTLLVINELPQFRSLQLEVKYGLYFVCLLSFLIFLVPMAIGTVSIYAFLISIVLTMSLSFAGYWDLKKKGISHQLLQRLILIPSGSVSALFLIFYLTNVMPPVPLATKYMGIYHSIEKMDNQYKLGYTRSSWKIWQNGDQSFYARSNDQVICFVQVFAPGSISQEVFYHWQWYQNGEWITADRIPLKITGGRRNGYRGYMKKSNFSPGDWRVILENADGREISRIYFEIIKESSENLPEVKFDFR